MTPPARTLTLLLAAALAGACEEEDYTNPRTPDQPHCVVEDSGDTDLDFVDFPAPETPGVDYDCDGWVLEDDCDDQDKDVWPGAREYNNGKDDDCDKSAEPLYGCGITNYDEAQDRDAVSGRRWRATASPGVLLLLFWRHRRCARADRGARSTLEHRA